MKTINYIKPIKTELEKELHKASILYMTIGSNSAESPRYLNFGDYDKETETLTIRSTQRIGISFTIPVKYEKYIFGDSLYEFWGQFKKFRTKFLQENYPTIEIY